MKILESAPGRYDTGISILTLGKLNKAQDRLIMHIHKGANVLDIGCGTGSLTLKAAAKGARVKGIDINPAMLETAARRIRKALIPEKAKQNITLCEMGIGELGNEAENSYDAVMSSLCFSELSEEEIRYTLNEVRRILKTGALLLIADETVPENFFKRAINALFRLPLVIITYIITQTTTRAVKNLPKKLKDAGFTLESVRLNKLGNFTETVARNIKEDLS
ncbi:MAG: class I SAM-dependent methyltransferase [Spirochaetes bacterium]|nr:class I SAM-dependent methyltransferase [Spirochaetota bacterium]